MTRILLGVTGSAACFKAVALCSELVQSGHEVQPVLTRSASRLVKWEPSDPAGMDHIILARRADLLLVAPATADFLGQTAAGLATSLLGSLVLAMETEKPRIFVPAMNPRMWSNPAVKRNTATLERDGWMRIGPVSGPTACGEEGEGRMVESAEILSALTSLLQGGE